MKKNKKIKKIKIYKSPKSPKHLKVAEATHIALEVCIYMLSNVGPHFINCVVNPQNFGPNWSLCCDIKRFVATELLVFVVAFVVASSFLSRPVLKACS